MTAHQRLDLDLQARCACGGVTLSLSGPVKSMFLCSCQDCQKATGTGHSAVVLMKRPNLDIAGTVKSFARPAASGASFTRSFCPECGTPLFGQSSRAPDLVMIPVGLLGDSTSWFHPRHLIFARSHLEWDVVAADLPRHGTYGRHGGEQH